MGALKQKVTNIRLQTSIMIFILPCIWASMPRAFW